MAKEIFLYYPTYSTWKMPYKQYEIHSDRIIHSIDLVPWSEGHDLIPVLLHAKQCHATFKEVMDRVYISRGKKEMDKKRDYPAKYYIKTVHWFCDHPSSEKRTHALLLNSVFTQVDPKLTDLSFAEQSREFKKLRKLNSNTEMEAAMVALDLKEVWDQACAEEDAFLAFEDELQAQEKVERKHTEAKIAQLRDAIRMLVNYIEVLTNIHEDPDAEHVMQNIIVEMNRVSALQKSKETRKENLEEEDLEQEQE